MENLTSWDKWTKLVKLSERRRAQVQLLLQTVLTWASQSGGPMQRSDDSGRLLPDNEGEQRFSRVLKVFWASETLNLKIGFLKLYIQSFLGLYHVRHLNPDACWSEYNKNACSLQKMCFFYESNIDGLSQMCHYLSVWSEHWSEAEFWSTHIHVRLLIISAHFQFEARLLLVSVRPGLSAETDRWWIRSLLVIWLATNKTTSRPHKQLFSQKPRSLKSTQVRTEV